jgi:solute carrier family 25 folate transporter 32
LYRGLTPNLIGNSTSWALFFYFKSLAEDQLLLLHNGISGTQKGYELRSGDYLLSSGVSGTFVTLSTNPIWVVKTRMLSSDKGAEGAYKNMWHGARQVFKHEGWRGFYRGAGVSLLGNTHGAVQFAVYEPMKKAWRRYLSTSNPSTHVNLEGHREDKLSNTALLVMSGAAKVFAGTATYPYQVIRSRLQTYESEKRFGKGIKGVMERIWREDGVKGFYRGLGPNIVKVLPSTWATFLVYENVKYYLSVWAADDDVSAAL